MSDARVRGFALPVALALTAVLALLTGDALQGAAASLDAATRARIRQRAFAAAETGLARALRALDEGNPAQGRRELPLPDGASVQVELRLAAVEFLPAGFSADRVRAEHYSLAATGRADARTRVRLEAGASRLRVVE